MRTQTTFRRSIQRRGFSLAELMIAIGIFGVGMLMVAATFPVGLEQARLTSEETHAPLVANEAFAQLEMLLEDPTPRLTANPPININDTTNVFTLRQVLTSEYPVDSGVLSNAHAMGLFSDLVLLPEDGSGNQYGVSLNAFLAMPFEDSANDPLVYLGGAETGYYPSTRTAWMNFANTDGPRYYWTAIYRLGTDPVTQQLQVEFTVFVTRGVQIAPVLFAFEMPPTTGMPIVDQNTVAAPIYEIPPGDPLANTFPQRMPDGSYPEFLVNAFDDGGLLIRHRDGLRFEVSEINVGTQTVRLQHAGAGNIAADHLDDGGVEYFWMIPTDPETGTSPLVGVFSRSFPLN